MTHTNTRRVIVITVIVLVVAAFAYDRIPGWRALGIVASLYGALIIWRRRAAYGRPDHEASRYTDDAIAMLVGLVVIAIGAVFLMAPEIIDHVYMNARLRG